MTIATFTAIVTVVLLSMQLVGSRKARLEILPQIEALVADSDIDGAYAMALEAQKYLPDDPLLKRLWSDIAVRMSFVSEPAGAEVFYKRYSDVDSDWELLGTTPVVCAGRGRATYARSTQGLHGRADHWRSTPSFDRCRSMYR